MTRRTEGSGKGMDPQSGDREEPVGASEQADGVVDAPESGLYREMIHGVGKTPAAGTGAYAHTGFPQQLVIESTGACNQSCIFCGRTYMDRPHRHMPRSVHDQIVEEVGRESPETEVWPAFMGEAFLLGDELFDRLQYAREVGCQKLTLNTNGTWLERFVPRLLEQTLDRLIISCDAHTQETHAKVRPGHGTHGTQGLEGIYRGVDKLIDSMAGKGLKWPLIEMQFSVFEENEHEVEAFVSHWLERGVVVKTRPKLYWSGLVDGGGERAIIGSDRQPCLWAMDSAAIQSNGNMVMCPVDAEGKYVAGNVSLQTVKEIWDGALRWIRELHLQRRFRELPEVCRRCPDWQVKRANAHFPNDEVRDAYETYVRRGRVFMQPHIPSEQ